MRRGVFILVDPYVLENIRSADGEIIEHFNNKQWFKVMNKLGYQHQGFTTGYSAMSQIRWHSILDLKDKSEQQLLKDMSYQTRRNIMKTIEMVCKLKLYQLKKRIDFIDCITWLKKNMVFIFKKNLILNKCLKFMVIKACMKLAYIDLNKYINFQEEPYFKQMLEIYGDKSMYEVSLY